MSVVSQKAMEKYDPDLIVFSLSNKGPRFFLAGTPDIPSYYKKDPTLWAEIFPARYLQPTRWLSTKTKLALLSHVAGYRLILSAKLASESDQRFLIFPYNTKPYLDASSGFFKKARGKTGVLIFVCPAVEPPDTFKQHYQGKNVPVFYLSAAGKPDEYRLFHPPAYVMDWYAEKLAAWLIDQKMIPANPALVDAQQ
jgi:hypothetical protein